MSALAAILGWIGAGIIVSLAIYGGLTVLRNVENHFAIRARLKSIGEQPRDDLSEGDSAFWSLPRDFKVLHGRESGK